MMLCLRLPFPVRVAALPSGYFTLVKADQFELFAPRTELPNGNGVAGPPKGYKEQQQWIESTLSEPARSWAMKVIAAPMRGVIGVAPPPPPKGLPPGAAARILTQLRVVANQQRTATIPATERKDVQAPGSRGSTKWRRAGEQQKVRYDDAPAPAAPKAAPGYLSPEAAQARKCPSCGGRLGRASAKLYHCVDDGACGAAWSTVKHREKHPADAGVREHGDVRTSPTGTLLVGRSTYTHDLVPGGGFASRDQARRAGRAAHAEAAPVAPFDYGGTPKASVVHLPELKAAVADALRRYPADTVGGTRLAILLHPHVYRVWQALQQRQAPHGALYHVERTPLGFRTYYTMPGAKSLEGVKSYWNQADPERNPHGENPSQAWNGVWRHTPTHWLDELANYASGHGTGKLDERELWDAQREGLRLILSTDMPEGFSVGQRFMRASGDVVEVVGARDGNVLVRPVDHPRVTPTAVSTSSRLWDAPVKAPAPTPFDDRSTPGTRVQWHGLGEWLSGYETLARRARKPSAGAQAAIKEHLAALDRETIAGATSTDQLRNAQLILRNMQPATALGRAEHATTQRLQWVNDRLYALGEKPGKAPQQEVRFGAGIAPRSPRHIADEIRPLRLRANKGEDVSDQLARLNAEMARALDATPDDEVAKRVKAWADMDRYRENKVRGARLIDDLISTLPPSGGLLELPPPPEKPDGRRWWYVVSRDTHPGSPGWRATKFTDDGIVGHEVGATPAEAVKWAVEYPHDQVRLRHGSVEAFERLTESEPFRRGNSMAALTQMWNRLQYEGRTAERDKLDELMRAGDLAAAERYVGTLDKPLQKAELGGFFEDMRTWGWL